ncbi:MAG: protein-disulfide reductase DsbD family protein [Bryobacteraceae bacterium]|nr:protein-disulfide reductase DsbD family protein [Bryobacteraceae bacterium]
MPAAAALALCLSLPSPSAPQSSAVLTVAEPAKVSLRRETPVTVPLTVSLKDGYHVNSTTPPDPYLIPLKLTWDEALVKVEKTDFPKPLMQKFEFSEKPLSVYEGSFDIKTTLRAPKTAATGPNVLVAKLRYQACSNTACLPPKTVEVKVPVVIQ